jgi:hypothetical protein
VWSYQLVGTTACIDPADNEPGFLISAALLHSESALKVNRICAVEIDLSLCDLVGIGMMNGND